MEKSVKANVIALASADPFLTVEELSELADTTPRYVRTILSEAGLSLNRLRRQYARRLERRLGEETRHPAPPCREELEVLKITGADVHSSLADWGRDAELFQINGAECRAGTLVFVQLITPCSVTVRPNYISLRELLPYQPEELIVGEQKIETVPNEKQLGFDSKRRAGGYMFLLSSVLRAADETIALERCWFESEGIVLRWSRSEPELKVHKTG